MTKQNSTIDEQNKLKADWTALCCTTANILRVVQNLHIQKHPKQTANNWILSY